VGAGVGLLQETSKKLKMRIIDRNWKIFFIAIYSSGLNTKLSIASGGAQIKSTYATMMHVTMTIVLDRSDHVHE
jgi:hypothetical protein